VSTADRPIGVTVRSRPAEYARLRELAEQEKRSLGNCARHFIIAAILTIDKQAPRALGVDHV